MKRIYYLVKNMDLNTKSLKTYFHSGPMLTLNNNRSSDF